MGGARAYLSTSGGRTPFFTRLATSRAMYSRLSEKVTKPGPVTASLSTTTD